MSIPAAIDVHSHIVPERFPPYAGGASVPWPSMAKVDACHCNVMIEGKNYRTVDHRCWAPEERVKEMDRIAVGVQCLSPMPELLSYWFPAAQGQAMARYLNEEIARMVARYPGRFQGFGTVPLQDMDLALRELEYIVKELRFPGVEIASHVNGVSIGDPAFEPFFAAVESMDLAVFVHALRPAGMDRIVGPISEQAVCFPGDIGLSAASMITGGMAERHPKLKIAFSHGGGVLSFLVGRLHRAWSMAPKLKETVPQEPAAYARRFYYDSIVFDPANLRHMIASFGASQVLVGSDIPFVMGDPDPVAFLKRCGLDESTLAAILRDNAERFLSRPVH